MLQGLRTSLGWFRESFFTKLIPLKLELQYYLVIYEIWKVKCYLKKPFLSVQKKSLTYFSQYATKARKYVHTVCVSDLD